MTPVRAPERITPEWPGAAELDERATYLHRVK
jgi:hypothetical protein